MVIFTTVLQYSLYTAAGSGYLQIFHKEGKEGVRSKTALVLLHVSTAFDVSDQSLMLLWILCQSYQKCHCEL